MSHNSDSDAEMSDAESLQFERTQEKPRRIRRIPEAKKVVNLWVMRIHPPSCVDAQSADNQFDEKESQKSQFDNEATPHSQFEKKENAKSQFEAKREYFNSRFEPTNKAQSVPVPETISIKPSYEGWDSLSQDDDDRIGDDWAIFDTPPFVHQQQTLEDWHSGELLTEVCLVSIVCLDNDHIYICCSQIETKSFTRKDHCRSVMFILADPEWKHDIDPIKTKDAVRGLDCIQEEEDFETLFGFLTSAYSKEKGFRGVPLCPFEISHSLKVMQSCRILTANKEYASALKRLQPFVNRFPWKYSLIWIVSMMELTRALIEGNIENIKEIKAIRETLKNKLRENSFDWLEYLLYFLKKPKLGDILRPEFE